MALFQNWLIFSPKMHVMYSQVVFSAVNKWTQIKILCWLNFFKAKHVSLTLVHVFAFFYLLLEARCMKIRALEGVPQPGLHPLTIRDPLGSP